MSDESFCSCHSGVKVQIKDHETMLETHDKKISTIETKLNLILGGVFLSPFLVAAFMLLIKSK